MAFYLFRTGLLNARYILRQSDSAQSRLFGERLDIFRMLVEGSVRNIGMNRAGRNRVDADFSRREFLGEVSGLGR